MHRGLAGTVAILGLLLGASSKCPPAPDSFEVLDRAPQPLPLQRCNELQEHDRHTPFEAVKARLKRCSSTISINAGGEGGGTRRGGGGQSSSAGPRSLPTTTPSSSAGDDCRWQVVNLGLEKTGTSEVANLLRLLNVSGLSFASPRGAAHGLQVLERCACAPGVKFVLTARNLLDMVVSRMSYHRWSCDEEALAGKRWVGSGSGNISGNLLSDNASSSTGAASEQPPPRLQHARCGGQDPSCCWRRDPRDLLQSWVLCRDAYHLRVVQLLAAARAEGRLLVVSLLHEVRSVGCWDTRQPSVCASCCCLLSCCVASATVP